MNKLERFLKFYSNYLLWLFITIIVVETLIIILFPAYFVKEAVVIPGQNPNAEIPLSIYRNDYISLQEIDRLEKKQLYINILGFVCIIGIIVFNPDIRNGIKDIYNKLREVKVV